MTTLPDGLPPLTPPPMPNGDYEQRRGRDGALLVEGACAGCGARVRETDPHVVCYSENIDERGGIFHAGCRPIGPQWHGVGEEE